MNAFFGEKADDYRYAHLMSALEVIPYMVCVDEFQHKVFENIGMTAKERRAIWHQLELTYMPWRNYDGHKFLEEGGFWMQKQHIFVNRSIILIMRWHRSVLSSSLSVSKKSRKRRGAIITVSARQAEAKDILHCWSWPD